MLDPNEWTLAFAVAIVPKRHRYQQEQALMLTGADGRHVRVEARTFNGTQRGMREETLPIGAMENQARAVLENVFAAAEELQASRRGIMERGVMVTIGEDREPTLHEVWRD